MSISAFHPRSERGRTGEEAFMVAAISAFDHEPPLSTVEREKGLSSWPPPDFSQGEGGGVTISLLCATLLLLLQPQRPPLLFPPKELRATK